MTAMSAEGWPIQAADNAVIPSLHFDPRGRLSLGRFAVGASRTTTVFKLLGEVLRRLRENGLVNCCSRGWLATRTRPDRPCSARWMELNDRVTVMLQFRHESGFTHTAWHSPQRRIPRLADAITSARSRSLRVWIVASLARKLSHRWRPCGENRATRHERRAS